MCGQGIPYHHVVPIGGAQHFQARFGGCPLLGEGGGAWRGELRCCAWERNVCPVLTAAAFCPCGFPSRSAEGPCVPFPTSVVSTLLTALSWERLGVEHCRPWNGREARGKQQQL